VPSAKNSVPCATGGKLEIVKLAIVPSASVAANPVLSVVGPAFTAMFAFVTSKATGGLLPTGMVYVAGVTSTNPRLSVAVKVNVLLPVNAPFGSNFKLEAWAGVST
jgi:hypothetical protein